MSEDSKMSRLRLPSSWELAPVPALDDDNLLSDILLRLPPLPSFLRRASLVCKRWRNLVSEPHFLRRFRSHHQKAPLLGFIYDDWSSRNIGFISTLDSPDRIPAAHFSLQHGELGIVLDCRHGLVLVLNREKEHVHVWDAVTRDHRYVALSPAFNDVRMYVMEGIVLCAAKDQGHVHGACHSDHFQVVLVGEKGDQFCISVYSSDTGAWGDIISLSWSLLNMRTFSPNRSGILIGNSVCWLLITEEVKILQFDLDEQNIAFLDVPSDVCVFDLDAYNHYKRQFAITPADDGALNFITLEGLTVDVWKRMRNGNGVSRWMLGNTFKLCNLLSLKPSADEVPVLILALDEDGNMMLKLADGGVTVMVHLRTMKFKKLTEKMGINSYHPFTSFYNAGT